MESSDDEWEVASTHSWDEAEIQQMKKEIQRLTNHTASLQAEITKLKSDQIEQSTTFQMQMEKLEEVFNKRLFIATNRLEEKLAEEFDALKDEMLDMEISRLPEVSSREVPRPEVPSREVPRPETTKPEEKGDYDCTNEKWILEFLSLRNYNGVMIQILNECIAEKKPLKIMHGCLLKMDETFLETFFKNTQIEEIVLFKCPIDIHFSRKLQLMVMNVPHLQKITFSSRGDLNIKYLIGLITHCPNLKKIGYLEFDFSRYGANPWMIIAPYLENITHFAVSRPQYDHTVYQHLRNLTHLHLHIPQISALEGFLLACPKLKVISGVSPSSVATLKYPKITFQEQMTW